VRRSCLACALMGGVTLDHVPVGVANECIAVRAIRNFVMGRL
jgi:hypothetical protein